MSYLPCATTHSQKAGNCTTKGQERTVIVQLLQRIGLADRTPKALATYIA